MPGSEGAMTISRAARTASVALLLVACAFPAVRAQAPVAADSTSRGGLRDSLQAQDRASYDAELMQTNPSFQDSVQALLDSLGVEALKKSQRKHLDLRLRFNPARKLLNYNRVEGFVAAAGLDVDQGEAGPHLELQAGYAFGSERFRHYESLDIPLHSGTQEVGLELYFEDRVQPYGANRPLLNSIRAFVGGEDAQDYLEREGGGALLSWRPLRWLRTDAGYEAGEETSVAKTTEFSLFGEMEKVNAPIDDGIDRRAVAGLEIGTLSRERWRIQARHWISGGGLGGDFVYNRTDLGFSVRRYLGRQEFYLQTVYVRTGADTPVQRLADVGGLTSVRGFRRRAQVGTSAFTSSLEYYVPYDLLAATHLPLLDRTQLQFVPWADAARTWGGDSDVWIQSAGIGMQRFLGAFQGFAQVSFLRFDFIFPMGPDRPDDIRYELYFAKGLF